MIKDRTASTPLQPFKYNRYNNMLLSAKKIQKNFFHRGPRAPVVSHGCQGPSAFLRGY